MLRINLLPSYVQQRRLSKKLVPLFAAIFALCAAAPLALYFYQRGQLATLTQQANDAVTGKSKTDALKTQATTTIAQVAPIQAKLQFVDDVNDHTRQVVALWNRLADTTPKNSFIYTGASVTGTTMSIKAYSKSVEDVGTYLQAMYHEPDFVTVAVDHIPAYPENVRHLYFYRGALVFADGASGGGAAQGGSQGGSGSYPGSQGGGYPGGGGQGGGQQGGGQTAGAPANWTPDALGPNGPSNIPPDVGPPPPQLAGVSAGIGNTQGQGGSTQGGSAGGYSERFLRIAGKGISPFASPAARDQILAKRLRQVVQVTVPKGFDINVTATLKQALTLPSLPGAAPAGGASGPGRGPGGFSGGPGASSGPPASASSG